MFRDVGIFDLELLYEWRRAQEREGIAGGWYQGGLTSWDEHRHWFVTSRARVRFWLVDGEPAGVLRIESDGSLAFWCPPPTRGEAVPMLQAAHGFAEEFGGRLKATVDEGDTGAIRVLGEAGFRRYPAAFLCFRSSNG